jgi:hypothetical protein
MMHYYHYCRSDEHAVVDVVCACCPAQEMLAHKKAVQRMGKKSKVSWAGWLLGLDWVDQQLHACGVTSPCTQ